MLADQALDRLQRGPDRSAGHREFTSDLSIEELAAVEEAGFEPRELVGGTCVFRVGWQFMGWTEAREVDVLSTAMYESRERAMQRLVSEAARVGADGVVGVHLDIDFDHWGSGLGEFTALGTAVRHRDRPGSMRTPTGEIFTSDLSGQDLWMLLRTGYRPLGLVMGCCVYHYSAQGISQWFGNLNQNAELPNLTSAFYTARELAMDRMQKEALGLGAAGVVGVTVSQQSHVWGGHTLEFLAIGTAVRAMETATAHDPTRMVRHLDA
ncbi:MAG TPA: heavy metal-binding domain-containing protein [Candidatus Acidoferrales bacterium]|nr:heavy metal-binding domain-containing protein [Candidatus Acidoferrales bacterium]